MHDAVHSENKMQRTGHTSHDSGSANMCIQWTYCSTSDRYGNKYAPASESYHAYYTDDINCTTLHVHLMYSTHTYEHR
jgi:hypothetical protein